MAPAQDGAALPELSWALSPCQPRQEPPVPFHLGTGAQGSEHGSEDAGDHFPPSWRPIPPSWGPWLPLSHPLALCPPQLWGQQGPRVHPALLGPPSPAEEEPGVCSCSWGSSGLPQSPVCCPGPCPAPCGHHEERQDGHWDGTSPGDTLGTVPPAPHPSPCKV